MASQYPTKNQSTLMNKCSEFFHSLSEQMHQASLDHLDELQHQKLLSGSPYSNIWEQEYLRQQT
ncbi:hypothetical protein [Vibrio gangliei]|uniref:hypothetical protein n=1 Tax=Vibrio gangliei TaxID=2077090 RepID=UPI000D01C88A|nr:hypothetical protein [Vibrio gangliei]